ncbi:hypothetical protein B9J93_01530 [Vibrio sp. V17_P4S1T151]|nr:hypothetical protein B9J93_01530 [Vibrio sp. V17_P4S1T151]
MDNKQIAITEFGGPEVLVIQTSDVPQPKAGEVLVKVAFAGVNPIDVKTRAGLGWAAAQNKDKLPWVPGYDISGQVVEVGEDNRRFQIGDNVAGFVGFPLRGGGYSQYLFFFLPTVPGHGRPNVLFLVPPVLQKKKNK